MLFLCHLISEFFFVDYARIYKFSIRNQIASFPIRIVKNDSRCINVLFHCDTLYAKGPRTHSYRTFENSPCLQLILLEFHLFHQDGNAYLAKCCSLSHVWMQFCLIRHCLLF